MENKIAYEVALWASSYGIQLNEDSPRTINQLYQAVQRGEMQVFKDANGEPYRYGRASMVEVFYRSTAGKAYRLHEERYKLNKGRTLEEFLQGDMSAATPSTHRTAIQSISETLYFKTNELDQPEDPRLGAVRALWEELFKSHYPQGLQDEIEPRLAELIEEHLLSLGHEQSKREPEDPNNSYRGLQSLTDFYLHQITFSPDMEIPIDLKNDIPQPLYEYDPEKGYINLYPWTEVTEEGL